MVVSEIGEQWSPHTAPAIHAEIQMIASGLSIENTFCTIGISMPKVPPGGTRCKCKAAADNKYDGRQKHLH